MPRRQVLTERSRAALFDLPTDEPSLLRHYTLAEDDIEHIRARRLHIISSGLRFSSVPSAIRAVC